ncbi:MAG: phosphate signaling complex protein PhoU [Spirochaetia bacterium]|nr:phosphate signaling complex protein PhoU [Spirochaetia bacterium]
MLKVEKSVLELRKTLEEMTDIVISIVDTIRTCIKKENFETLEFVFQQDRHIDDLEKKIDQQAVALLALINPMASDLRFVFSVVKLNSDLERIGDECKNVAKELKTLEPPIPEDLKILADKVYEMVKDAVNALLNQNSALAQEIILKDDEVDKLEYSIQKKYSNSIGIAFAAKALERIADHTTNISENVVFATEGIDIRHENSIMNRLGKSDK